MFPVARSIGQCGCASVCVKDLCTQLCFRYKNRHGAIYTWGVCVESASSKKKLSSHGCMFFFCQISAKKLCFLGTVTLKFEVIKKVLHGASNDRYGAVFTTGPDGPES